MVVSADHLGIGKVTIKSLIYMSSGKYCNKYLSSILSANDLYGFDLFGFRFESREPVHSRHRMM